MADEFFWYELMTSDVEGAKAFYGAVVGWKMTAFDGSNDYTVLEVGDKRGVGGIMPLPDDSTANGLTACWVGYVHVTDIDAKVTELRKAGGSIHREPFPVEGVGRIAVVADRQGTMFNLLQPNGQNMPPLVRGTAGKIDWHELHSTDWQDGCSFYETLFGWSKSTAMDMGPMGTYQLFTMAGNGDDGGMMNEPPNAGPAPYWMFYFSVDAIDPAHKRITDAGGTVMMGPHEVPGGAWIITGTDPQGAIFSVVAPKR